jgi:polyhydroxyalkanoate synthesis regulator phasin
MKKFLLLPVAFMAFGFMSSPVFAQTKDIEKLYNELDSLENRVLELKKENDKAILECLENKNWRNSEKVTPCRLSYAGLMDGVDWSKAMEYRNEICECAVGKKHEIAAVETRIKQIERRIDLKKNDNTPPKKEK